MRSDVLNPRRPPDLIRLGILSVLALAVLSAAWEGLRAPAVSAEPAGVTNGGERRPAPTATCPQAATDELSRTVDFVRGKSWAKDPNSTALSITTDTTACRVVLRINPLSAQERAKLIAGGGSRLVIHYEHDYHSSRLPLILWVVFGGSGLLWLYRRNHN